MAKAKWYIINLGSQKDVQELCYSVLENGRDVEVISFQEAAELATTKDDSKQCVVTGGSIWFNRTLRENKPNWVGSWHNQETFACHSYYGYWGKYIAQQNYVMIPLGEIKRRKDWLFEHFDTDALFFRPDSGEKEFNGELIEKGRFDQWITTTRNFIKSEWHAENANDGMICVVAPPLNIKKELRLLIKGGKVITGSTYKVGKHIYMEDLEEQEDKAAIIEFAEKVANDNPPPLPPVYMLDVALLDSGYTVMEIGCCCCCGRYMMDLRKFSLAISEAAEEAFDAQENTDIASTKG